jgi:hypothetical protein
VERDDPDLGLATDPELAHDRQQPLREEAVEGLLGLPDVAYLDTLVGDSRHVQHRAGRRVRIEAEPRHDGVVLVGGEARPVHGHRDSHSQSSLPVSLGFPARGGAAPGWADLAQPSIEICADP